MSSWEYMAWHHSSSMATHQQDGQEGGKDEILVPNPGDTFRGQKLHQIHRASVIRDIHQIYRTTYIPIFDHSLMLRVHNASKHFIIDVKRRANHRRRRNDGTNKGDRRVSI